MYHSSARARPDRQLSPTKYTTTASSINTITRTASSGIPRTGMAGSVTVRPSKPIGRDMASRKSGCGRAGALAPSGGASPRLRGMVDVADDAPPLKYDDGPGSSDGAAAAVSAARRLARGSSASTRSPSMITFGILAMQILARCSAVLATSTIMLHRHELPFQPLHRAGLFLPSWSKEVNDLNPSSQAP